MLYVRVVSNGEQSYIPVEEVISYKKTDFAQISIVNLETYGKTIVLDDEVQTCALDFFSYHQDLVFPHKANPGDKAIVLGAGEGCSTDLLLLCGYSVTSIDIDPQAIELYRKHIPDWNNKIYDRTDEFKMVFGCALEYLKKQPSGDVEYIIFDLDTISLESMADDFFKEIHRVLLTGGVCSAQDGHYLQASITDKYSTKYFTNLDNIKEGGSMEWRFKHLIK